MSLARGYRADDQPDDEKHCSHARFCLQLSLHWDRWRVIRLRFGVSRESMRVIAAPDLPHATELGVSQMQIARLLAAVLLRLRQGAGCEAT